MTIDPQKECLSTMEVPEEVPKVEADLNADIEGSVSLDNGSDAKVEAEQQKGCCKTFLRFDGNQMAQGYNILGMARGSVMMSNIFFTTAVLYLANEAVGCVEENEDGVMVVTEDCEGRVYGLFRPSSMISNVLMAAGLMAAVFMPLMGAIIDYTPYRWEVGVVSAALMTLIQATQIGVAAATWFFMAMIQAVAMFLFEVQITCSYAYLPFLTDSVGEQKMTKYTSVFMSTVFSSQVAFIVLIIVVAGAIGLADVGTARISQAINTVILIPTFYLGWKLLPRVRSHNQRPTNPKTGKPRALWSQGFVELWNTAKRINRDYRKGLRWFLLATMFAEAGADSFTVVSIVFLDEEMGLSAVEIGVFFMAGMIFMPPGTYLSKFVSDRTNPKVSYMLAILVSQITGVVGALTLNKSNIVPGGYIWAIFVGLNMGWYYPAQILFFGSATPNDGHETELAGLFSYCLIILSWLPNLIYSAILQAGVASQIGLLVITVFFTIGFILLCFASSWEEIVAECQAGGDKAATNEEIRTEKEDTGNASLDDDVGRTERSSSVSIRNSESSEKRDPSDGNAAADAATPVEQETTPPAEDQC